jgi:uroporphyrinogen III methyltransferase/synthase
MRTVFAPLKNLESARRHAGLEAPGLILVGKAVAQRTAASWFEQRPLFGHRVLVTRPRALAAGMMRRLELLGAVPYLLPTLEIREPADSAPLDAALDRLRDRGWDWVVFTSANGVNGFFRRLFARGRDVRDLGGVKLAAIGPKTAEALRSYHLTPDVVPPDFVAESLAAELVPRVAGQRVLLARANRGRDVLPTVLGKVAAVEQVTVYDQIDRVDSDSDALAALRRGEIGFVTISSSNIARALVGAFDETIRGRVQRGEIRLVAISPETGRIIRELGFPVAAEATVYTADGLIDAVVRLAAATG